MNSGAPLIQLLSEVDVDEIASAPVIVSDGEVSEDQLERSSDENEVVSASSEVVLGDSEKPLCTLIGPFPKLLRAEYFIERLSALDVSSSVYNVEISGDVGYWVYLPPEESRKQAYNKLRELQAKGIDSYVIPKGELENGISFGMFSQSKLAEQRLNDMKKQGYSAQLKEIARSFNEIWVLLQPGQAQMLGEKAWLEMLSDDEGIERRQNYCPAVASK